MLALCPGCHARVHRTRAALRAMPLLLLQLWREQHPRGHEQRRFDFRPPRPKFAAPLLFPDGRGRGLSGMLDGVGSFAADGAIIGTGWV